MDLQDRIEELFDTRVPARTPANLALLAEFRAGLNRGELRSVLSLEERWVVNVSDRISLGEYISLQCFALRNAAAEAPFASSRENRLRA